MFSLPLSPSFYPSLFPSFPFSFELRYCLKYCTLLSKIQVTCFIWRKNKARREPLNTWNWSTAFLSLWTENGLQCPSLPCPVVPPGRSKNNLPIGMLGVWVDIFRIESIFHLTTFQSQMGKTKNIIMYKSRTARKKKWRNARVWPAIYLGTLLAWLFWELVDPKRAILSPPWDSAQAGLLLSHSVSTRFTWMPVIPLSSSDMVTSIAWKTSYPPLEVATPFICAHLDCRVGCTAFGWAVVSVITAPLG